MHATTAGLFAPAIARPIKDRIKKVRIVAD